MVQTFSFKKQRSKPNNLESLIDTLKRLDVSSNDDNKMVLDETEFIHLNISFKTALIAAIHTNDITKVSQLLREQEKEQYKIPDVDINFFYIIGKYCQGIIYSILRNSNIFEDKFRDSLYFDAIIEGIAKTDNYELLKYMTNTHQLTLITEKQLGVYLQCIIEARAYRCLECLTSYLSMMNSHNSQMVLKEVFARGIETLDNRVVTIILKSMRPITN